jgi:hypothetical protein
MNFDPVIALASAFAAGFAVQQAIEILDATIFSRWSPVKKRIALAWVSAILGVAFAYFGDIKILDSLDQSPDRTAPPFIDFLVSALVISAGTEGVNSLLKFLQYKKEEQKGEAVQTQDAAGMAAASDPPPLPLPAPAVPQGV